MRSFSGASIESSHLWPFPLVVAFCPYFSFGMEDFNHLIISLVLCVYADVFIFQILVDSCILNKVAPRTLVHDYWRLWLLWNDHSDVLLFLHRLCLAQLFFNWLCLRWVSLGWILVHRLFVWGVGPSLFGLRIWNINTANLRSYINRLLVIHIFEVLKEVISRILFSKSIYLTFFHLGRLLFRVFFKLESLHVQISRDLVNFIFGLVRLIWPTYISFNSFWIVWPFRVISSVLVDLWFRSRRTDQLLFCIIICLPVDGCISHPFSCNIRGETIVHRVD